nr:hypothetical protein [Tanacetum cinerariifolium]
NLILSLFLLKKPTQKGKRAKRPAKKATTSPTTRVVIRDTLDKYVSKKKAPAKADIGKGIELLSDASLLKDAQLKKTLRKSKRETHKLQASGSSEGVDFESETDSDDDENPTFTLKDYEEEEQDEECVHTLEKDKSDDKEKMYEEEDNDVIKELYRDLNITQDLRDTDMTYAKQGGEDQQNASYKSGFEQEEDNGHMTLTTVHDKTEGTMQSSSVSSDFTSKLLNLDNTGPDVNEIVSLMNTSIVPHPPSPFDQRVSTLETKMSEFNQTNQFGEAISSVPGIVDQYLASKVKETWILNHKVNNQGPDQGNESGHMDDQPDNEADPKNDWFQKADKPLTPDHAWNKSKSVDFRPPQNLISTIAKARQPPHIKPLPLIEDLGRQVVPAEYFINNDLKYLKGGSSSSKYVTFTTKTKDAKWYDYEYLEEIVVRRDDNVLYKFKEGDFPRLNLCDIEDILLLLVQKKLSNLDVDDWYDLEMDYLPKRYWNNLEMKRSRIMVKAIDKLLFERRLMRNLEKF